MLLCEKCQILYQTAEDDLVDCVEKIPSERFVFPQLPEETNLKFVVTFSW